MTNDNREMEDKASCETCGAEFESDQQLQQHNRQDHKE